jgi:hypothetical protein
MPQAAILVLKTFTQLGGLFLSLEFEQSGHRTQKLQPIVIDATSDVITDLHLLHISILDHSACVRLLRFVTGFDLDKPLALAGIAGYAVFVADTLANRAFMN